MRISDWSSGVCSSDLHLTVIRHEDHDRVLALPGAIERVEHPADLLIDQVAHRPISGTDEAVILVAHRVIGETGIAAIGAAMVDPLEGRLVVQFARNVLGQRDREIGRASCRESVVSVRVDLGGRCTIKKKSKATYTNITTYKQIQ